MTAWRDDGYLDLLRTAGLTTITRPDEAEWPVSETFAGKLYALLAEKKRSRFSLCNTHKRNSTIGYPTYFHH